VPVPPAPLVIESQPDWDVAVQEQEFPVVTVTDPDPPCAWNETDVVERL
jgi:hypothetical protein